MLENLEIKKGSKELIIDNLEELVSIDKNWFFNLAWNEEAFLSDLSSKFETSQLLFYQNQLIGYAIVSKKEIAFHLHKFVIHPEFKSMGVGQFLIETLLEKIKFQPLTLKVEIGNLNAIIFYLKKKFIFTEKSGDYYHMIYNGK